MPETGPWLGRAAWEREEDRIDDADCCGVCLDEGKRTEATILWEGLVDGDTWTRTCVDCTIEAIIWGGTIRVRAAMVEELQQNGDI